MKGKYLRKFGSLIFSLLLLPGVVALFSSTTAQAQRRVIIVPRYRYYNPWWGYRSWAWGYNPYFDYYSRYGHYVFGSSDAAYNQGFADGSKTGRNDAKDRKTYNPERSHYYQEAGYGTFGEVYRSGFLRGYADGYRS
ncbi:MAG TPA: hypothetical protein VE863_23080 [Pyrinomonadaceae bacterium]|jgi:hypothetical protein|nr:hypothetical protein [Pyrinomonadaceae bacterium]